VARHRGPVLVDTNAILECFRVGAWNALAGGYTVETVEECVIETQTGFQQRRREQQIDGAILTASLTAVHPVTTAQLAAVAVQAPDIALDVGERSLWAHALECGDTWVLCGPDKASLRFGVRCGFRNQLVSLEELLEAVGYRQRKALKQHFTAKWLDRTLAELVISEERERS
jgi:hypothetical protein